LKSSEQRATIIDPAKDCDKPHILGMREHSGVEIISENNLMVIHESRFARKQVCGYVGGGIAFGHFEPLLTECHADGTYLCLACSTTVVCGQLACLACVAIYLFPPVNSGGDSP
jgi:hypothetical protein